MHVGIAVCALCFLFRAYPGSMASIRVSYGYLDYIRLKANDIIRIGSTYVLETKIKLCIFR